MAEGRVQADLRPFVQMATLVLEQDESVQQIEQQAQGVHQDVESGFVLVLAWGEDSGR